ncbi:MAG: AbrB/MazE/SpoVT family DNA-binding domain-containing protein [SAR202 cluster bacterium]|nr:AbrB/MazE/SpoVT family DNA-binding domain-containing protein [SAR202 cluster bacterium]
MAEVGTKSKVVKTLGKGQITIPTKFREALGIGPETLLRVSLLDDRLEIRPLESEEGGLRRYTGEEVERFLQEDKLDAKTVKRVRALLKQGKL